MITDDDAKKLVATMREMADKNAEQARLARNAYGRSHHEGRADAYYISAKWLEDLIPKEAKQ